MATQTMAHLDALISEADALSRVEIMVETNSGTYGAAEACRKIGCGDPAFADYRLYETVGGEKRREGCDPEEAPGRARRVNRDDLRAKRRQLADLRKQITAARRREAR